MCYCPTPTLHLNLALTGDGAFIFSLKKTHSVWFISVLNYGDTENVLINHLLLVIPMSYPCHYTNLCPHKPHKHAHTHTHTHSWNWPHWKHVICLRSSFPVAVYNKVLKKSSDEGWSAVASIMRNVLWKYQSLNMNVSACCRFNVRVFREGEKREERSAPPPPMS